MIKAKNILTIFVIFKKGDMDVLFYSSRIVQLLHYLCENIGLSLTDNKTEIMDT